jgi:hypothetical protein
MAYPLTGQKGKLGTGSWVAENWVCFVRISQFVYGWCHKDFENAKKYGIDDMSRLVIAFHAFVARCLTHSGIDNSHIRETGLYMKEFLSAVRELDIRVRYEQLNKTTTKVSERKSTEAWWLKPNYMSLPNLMSMMTVLGPLVLWWDGGGKGERFIQVVKPHIKRGVREDALTFFVNLTEKLFRVRQLDLLEKRFGLQVSEREELKVQKAEVQGLFDILNDIADEICIDDNDESVGHTTAPSDDEDNEEEEEEPGPVRRDDAYFSPNEIHGMTKTKTIYVYRNEVILNATIASKKPIAGIVELKTTGTKTAFEFQTVFRKPVKQFARRVVSFDDKNGALFHGLWCARINVEEENIQPTLNFTDIQSAAKLSAVAIPLRYILGDTNPRNDYYCVITNWWKYRMQNGKYQLPRLDPTLYGTEYTHYYEEEEIEDDLEDLLAAAQASPENDSDSENNYGAI